MLVNIVSLSKKVFLCLFFVFIAGVFSVEVGDPDFWWHLKTGEYIWETKSLPVTDPFSYTSLPLNPVNPGSGRIEFILTQYWLAQVLFYQIYNFFSFNGIIFLRAIILASLMFLLYRSMRREGAGISISLLSLLPVLIIFYSFTGERPQLFSFLFLFLLIYLIEGFRKVSRNKLVSVSNIDKTNMPRGILYLLPIPVIMLLWANMHGGFILGVLIIVLYIFTELIKHIIGRFGKSLPSYFLKVFIIVGTVSVLGSFINPNNYQVLSVLAELKKGIYIEMISETMSPFALLKMGLYNLQVIVFFALICISVITFLVNIKKADFTDISMFLFLCAIGISGMRFIPFFAPVAVLMTVRNSVGKYREVITRDELKDVKTGIERICGIAVKPWITAALPVILSIVIIMVLIRGDLFKTGANMSEYPEGAVRFMKDNKLPGNMFNPYYWGGYLIWALYPDYKVFADGRALIEEISFIEENIMEVSRRNFGGVPEWKAYIDAYKINFILTYSVRRLSGQLGPLIPALLQDSEWSLIFKDNNSLIFMRNIPENDIILSKYRMPKELLWDEVIEEAFLKLGNSRNKANFFITIGDAFFAKKDLINAGEAYSRALKESPGNNIAKQRLDFLRTFTVNPGKY